MSGEEQGAKKGVWKKPEDACECIKYMEKNKLMRWAETGLAPGSPLAPIFDPFRGRKHDPYVFLKFCPNCGQQMFDVVEGGPQ